MNKKTFILVLGCSIVAIIGLIVAICAGAKSIPLQTVWDSIFHYEDVLDMQLVRDVRIPRAISTAFVGGLLGITGAMMQGVTRNPVAEPSLMGITQGATFAIALLGMSSSLYGLLGNTLAAFVGAIISGLLVLAFSMKSARNMNMSRLLLAGTALSTFFISMATVIALLTNKSQSLAFWITGGFRAVTWNSVMLLLIVGGMTTIIALFLAPKINIVNLGEDVCIGLGENPVKIRMITLLLIIPMCAVCVAVAGNIAFVGLIVPHIIRKLLGTDYRVIMPVSFLGGAMLVIWADVLARLVNQPYETPIGLFTSLVGVPLFIWMVRKES
ncbi:MULTISPECIES: FecCD family ABC transporter permease [Turicibacter]|jgi:putative iron(3+)-hydroxamate import system permease protein FhuB|uniref:Iron chelate uptake ABC transporter family permease subunit n=2 Tax=Turicibacter sanguinis TaxID=154288 RepID=A0A173S7G1_9FIRM|nr:MULTISPECIES: iron ABC transporter permease [Turicibacter]EFF63666.1 putative ferrichrome transport system permease protein FhuB [Turicibacter sanguinis PC909]EGC92239.1 putative iron(3+)-hydroxamate import system permease protein FhuB [Turicibacter sp. HGF1]MBP3905271.1 iron ABC transporter permease [Turicibacter sp.]MCU7189896.1 iron ABC transporter permease [Turicibacter sanguinis]MCU7196979.1 iron ABC transporter permease [Turicibacter sanguinis]